eukprot:11106957-Lingulodinium_polyedra.AAC.1
MPGNLLAATRERSPDTAHEQLRVLWGPRALSKNNTRFMDNAQLCVTILRARPRSRYRRATVRVLRSVERYDREL